MSKSLKRSVWALMAASSRAEQFSAISSILSNTSNTSYIPGWMIPRMHQGLVANGWALNTEYFAEVLHLLRDDLTYTTIVDECLAVPAKPDKRDLTAIKRLCTAFVKLLYPNATCKDDIQSESLLGNQIQRKMLRQY